MVLNLALNYGGRSEIVRATKKIVRDFSDGLITPEKIDENLFSSYLYTNGQNDPDLIIRTAGEKRLSNFLLWQSAYAEYEFIDTLWPDFTKEIFSKLVNEYYSRERRFGGVV